MTEAPEHNPLDCASAEAKTIAHWCVWRVPAGLRKRSENDDIHAMTHIQVCSKGFWPYGLAVVYFETAPDEKKSALRKLANGHLLAQDLTFDEASATAITLAAKNGWSVDLEWDAK